MAKKHYDWSSGPAELDAHSLTKHNVLVGYLLRYFEQRTLNARGRERFKITLVDGFCGGGLYKLRGSNQEALGSPLRMLNAVEEARFKVNEFRTKPLELDVQYVFIDKDATAIAHLKKILIKRGHAEKIGKTVHLIVNDFAVAFPEVQNLVRSHTPQAKTALFFLDQYGYKDVPATLVQTVFKELPNSEIVLTFHVSSFATYTNDDFVEQIGNTLAIDIRTALGGQTIEDIKANDADWRRFIQGALYQSLVSNCGARFFTPFFIRGEGSGHGEYWLVHLSQHHRAQDVMKQVHWQYQNHFVHYGGAGLDMLAPHLMGFRQEFTGGFRFDDVARHQSNTALVDQLGKNIFASGSPKRIGDIFSSTCNTSPATAAMYHNALQELVWQHEIIITDAHGKTKRLARYMQDTDIVEKNPQTRLIYS